MKAHYRSPRHSEAWSSSKPSGGTLSTRRSAGISPSRPGHFADVVRVVRAAAGAPAAAVERAALFVVGLAVEPALVRGEIATVGPRPGARAGATRGVFLVQPDRPLSPSGLRGDERLPGRGSDA